MAPPRRASLQSVSSLDDEKLQDEDALMDESNNSASRTKNNGPPLKKRKMEKDTAATTLDPNAIDHSLDLDPPVVAAGPAGGAGATMSDALDAFPLFDDLVHEAIIPSLEHEDNEAAQTAAASAGVAVGDDDDHDDVAAAVAKEEQTAKKPKKKKTKRRSDSTISATTEPKPKQKKLAMTVEEIKKKYSAARLQRILKNAIQDARDSHEEERERVERQLPNIIKSQFGQIGFGKFGKNWFPALLISPFDISADLDEVKKSWYTHFEKALQDRGKFGHMVYWIGEFTYSLIGQNLFIHFDDAKSAHRKKYDAAKKKLETGLEGKSADEQYFMRAVGEVETLMKLDPAERRLQIPHPEQPHEKMTIDDLLQKMVEENFSIEDLEIDMGDDADTDDAQITSLKKPATLDTEQDNPPKKKKAKRKGKKEAETQDTTLQELPAAAKKTRKTKSQTKPAPETPLPAHEALDADFSDSIPKQAKKKKSRLSVTKEPATLDDSVEVDESVLDQVPKKKNKKVKGQKQGDSDAHGDADGEIGATRNANNPVTDGSPGEAKISDASVTNEFWNESAMDSKPPKEDAESSHSESSTDEDGMEDDIPTDDDKDDYDYEHEVGRENDQEDEVLELGVDATAKGGKKKSSKKTPSPKKKSEGIDKKKPESKRPVIPPEQMSRAQKRKWMTGRIKINEKHVVPILESLHHVNDETPMDDICKMLSDLDAYVERMCWQFMELHRVPTALKPAKKVMKLMKVDISPITRLKEKMKTQYENNKKDFDIPTIKTTPCETSYATHDPTVEKRDSIGANARSEGSTKKRDTPVTQDKSFDGRRRESEPEMGARKRMSTDSVPQSDKAFQKRKSSDSLPQSERRRDSTGSQAKDKAAANDEPVRRKSDKELQRKDSTGSLSRQDRVSLSGKHDDTTQPSKQHSGNVHDDDASHIPRKSASGTGSHKKESVQATTDSGRPAKPKPKKFSIASLVKPGGPEKASAQPRPSGNRELSTSKPKKQLPGWMRTECTLPPPGTKNRLFALEFFKEMTRQFSSDQVNRDGMALALEAETYLWANRKAQKDSRETKSAIVSDENMEGNTNDLYWKRVRAIVAVVSGKYNPGSLMHDLMKGEFETARDLVKISDEKLSSYFKTDLGL